MQATILYILPPVATTLASTVHANAVTLGGIIYAQSAPPPPPPPPPPGSGGGYLGMLIDINARR